MYKPSLRDGAGSCLIEQEDETLTTEDKLEDLLDFEFDAFERYCVSFVGSFGTDDWIGASATLMLISHFFSDNSSVFYEDVVDIEPFWRIFRKTEFLAAIESTLTDRIECISARVIEFLAVLSSVHHEFSRRICDSLPLDAILSFCDDINAVKTYMNCLPHILDSNPNEFDLDHFFTFIRASQSPDTASFMISSAEIVAAHPRTPNEWWPLLLEVSLEFYTDSLRLRSLNIWTRILKQFPEQNFLVTNSQAFARVLATQTEVMKSDEERESLWRLFTCIAANDHSICSHITWPQVMNDLLQRGNTSMSKAAADLIMVSIPEIIPQLGNIDNLLGKLVRLLDSSPRALVTSILQVITALIPHATHVNQDFLDESFIHTIIDLLEADSEGQTISLMFLNAITEIGEKKPATFAPLFELLRTQGIQEILENVENADQILNALTPA